MPAPQEQRPANDEARDPAALSVLLRELVAAPAPPAPAAGPIAPGEVVGKFEIIRELGRGGFGVVLEARDRELGRSVAFKVVQPGTSAVASEQLVQEAEAIARLSHPNLVTLFDAGRCEHGPFLVLELLRGRTLRARLEDGRLDCSEALRIAAEVARGLAHAHAEGVVHRDLKPSNVFLTEAGAVKVLDFGMAHAFGRQRVSGGTPAYMAPEQWREEPEDARADVFALGVLLYRMLSGRLPFGADAEVLQAKRPAPRLDVHGAPPALVALVARMLELDPARRPRNAGEVLAHLQAIQTERELATPRRRALAAALVTTALAGAVIGALVLRRTREPPAGGPRTIAVLPFASGSDAPDDRVFAAGVHGELITQLARVSGLRVIARTSVAGYEPAPRDLRAVAAALGADALLEGEVLRSGDRARVSVQLVDPRSRTALWADRFDREVGDVFAIQTEVALEIAGALGATLTPAERRAVEQPPTRDREAHELFRRGLLHWQRSIGVESDNRTAAELIGKAAARDPGFALAHAWLATIAIEWQEDCDAARAHATRAAGLGPDVPQLHVALGRILYLCERDAHGAIRELKQAVRDVPGDALARAQLGALLTEIGDYDAGLDELRRAAALDPRSYVAAAELARELAIVRRFDEAAEACARATDLAPGDVHALVLCALVPFWRSGDLADARRALDQLPAELPGSGNGAWSLFQVLGLFPDETLRLVAAGRVPDPFSLAPLVPRAYLVGRAHAGRGEAAAARAAFAAALPPLEARLAAAPGDAVVHLFHARALAGTGRADEALAEARAVLARATEPERRSRTLQYVAEIAAAAGRPADAIEALAEILRRRDGMLTAAAVRVDPRFQPLRGDPRLAALLTTTDATPPAPRP